jgi:hypothetical protein
MHLEPDSKLAKRLFRLVAQLVQVQLVEQVARAVPGDNRRSADRRYLRLPVPGPRAHRHVRVARAQQVQPLLLVLLIRTTVQAKLSQPAHIALPIRCQLFAG